MIVGLWPTMLVGMLGALIAELIRITPALTTHRWPSPAQIPVSVVFVALGAGAALLGWSDPQHAFTVAVLGAAFPTIFSNAIRATTASRTDNTMATRSLRANGPILSYAAGRF
jgi:hypothetical protein